MSFIVRVWVIFEGLASPESSRISIKLSTFSSQLQLSKDSLRTARLVFFRIFIASWRSQRISSDIVLFILVSLWWISGLTNEFLEANIFCWWTSGEILFPSKDVRKFLGVFGCLTSWSKSRFMKRIPLFLSDLKLDVNGVWFIFLCKFGKVLTFLGKTFSFQTSSGTFSSRTSNFEVFI